MARIIKVARTASSIRKGVCLNLKPDGESTRRADYHYVIRPLIVCLIRVETVVLGEDEVVGVFAARESVLVEVLGRTEAVAIVFCE